MRLSASLVLCAACSLVPAAALADTFYSQPGSTSYNGYDQNISTPTNSFSHSTVDIGNGDGVWAAPLAGSTWVSYMAGTNPNGAMAMPSNHAPDGYYTYSTTFTVNDLLDSYGRVSVMADDTVAVFLNNVQILAASNGPYPKCSTPTPNCMVPTTATFGNTNLKMGSNTLSFVVHQAADYATGLDYSGTVLTPEPSSLALLGTGLVGSAGAMLRRLRRTR